MTDPDLSLGDFAVRQQQAPSGPLPPPIRYAPKLAEPPFPDGHVDEEDDGEIACICQLNWDDGYTIQCETCNKWNHMECYYPNAVDRPGSDQTHYCVDCDPRPVDAHLANALQREKINEQQRETGAGKRPASKAGRKKTKDSPDGAPVANGWSADKDAHLHGRSRKSASPRDQPPPAKKPKTTHRSANAGANGTSGRKRNGATLNNHRSPSKSPAPGAADGLVYGPPIPACSKEFLNIPKTLKTHVNADTNIWNSIDVTTSLSNWLQDPETCERDCQLKQSDVFKRWDAPFDELPGKPEVSMIIRADQKFSQTGDVVQFPCATAEEHIFPETFIGELLGHVGFKSEYMDNPDSRWKSLRHCEPFVFFHPKLPLYIDARQEGSLLRYVRRSCRPNAEMQTIITEGTTYHFCFMATKEILPGDEITVGWEFDERIRSMYAQRTHMNDSGWAPDVRDKIAAWVSNVLSNCGPCACAGNGCPMAFFDRRGQSFPIDAEPATMKAPKRKRKAAHPHSADESGVNSNQESRSGSEVGNVEAQDDDMTDSRSVSGSYGEASRDITPNTHYSAAHAEAPKLSEREKKKLMREEEMFKKQEEEKGRQRKKRNSGGPNLNTPGASSSVCCERTMLDVLHKLTTNNQRQSGQPSKNADAGTSSRNPTASSKPGRRGGRQPLSSSRRMSKSSPKTAPRPVYVDTATQCDMDNDEPPLRPVVTPPKRKQYMSVTQRLLRRCASNNFRKKTGSVDQDDSKMEEDIPASPPPPPPIQGDTMDIDKDETPDLDADAADVLPLSPVSDKVREAKAIEETSDEPIPTPASATIPATGTDDSEMMDVDETDAGGPQAVPEVHVKADVSDLKDEPAAPASNPPMDPPPPPWPAKSTTDPSISTHEFTKPEAVTKSELHIPVPSLTTESSAASTSAEDVVQAGLKSPEDFAQAASKSPSAQTPGLGPDTIFPPSVNVMRNPSPIARKKMSLSDYTKRSKAQRPSDPSRRDSSPSASVMSTDLVSKDGQGALQGSAITESPVPESIPPSSAEEKTTATAEDATDLDKKAASEVGAPLSSSSSLLHNATFGDNGLPTVGPAAP